MIAVIFAGRRAGEEIATVVFANITRRRYGVERGGPASDFVSLSPRDIATAPRILFLPDCAHSPSSLLPAPSLSVGRPSGGHAGCQAAGQAAGSQAGIRDAGPGLMGTFTSRTGSAAKVVLTVSKSPARSRFVIKASGLPGGGFFIFGRPTVVGVVCRCS